MKKYKIIKTYPGSDKLGTVITLDKNGECWTTPQLIIENDCKNNPEFFEEIVEKKEVFLITEDGVKVNLKGEIHWVSNYVGGEIKYLYATSLVEPHLFILEDFKVFSSFEKAQEWIILNKPVLSVNDVDKYTEQFNAGEWLNKLKEVVKSRL